MMVPINFFGWTKVHGDGSRWTPCIVIASVGQKVSPVSVIFVFDRDVTALVFMAFSGCNGHIEAESAKLSEIHLQRGKITLKRNWPSFQS